jgi:hypothetical protein
MKRVIRAIITGLTLISLMVCLAIVGLWLRSHAIQDSFNWEFTTSAALYNVELISGEGDQVLKLHREVYIQDQREFLASFHRNNQRGFFYLVYPYPMSAAMGGRRFFLRCRQIGNHTVIVAGIPIWTIALFTGILPLIQGSLYVRRRIRRANRLAACVSCGYDLRATPKRCPECGTVPTKATA